MFDGQSGRSRYRTGGRIHVLSPQLANAIAAGEVVDRPASVVKELVENAIDAGSRRVEVEIRGGGKEYIHVRDDGVGIPPDQVALAFRRHATSKVSEMKHLEAVRTLGFRGEALPSIAAVARVELRSRERSATEGLKLRAEGGTLGVPEPVGAPVGTSVSVRDLFYNTPARLKFLKTTATERRYVIQTVGRLAMARADIAFRLVAEGQEILATAGKGDLLAAALAVWGKGLTGSLIPVGGAPAREPGGASAAGGVTGSFGEVEPVVWGFAGKPSAAKSQRTSQAVIVNGRWIESVPVRAAFEKAYHGLLPSRHFPVAVLHIEVDPATVDVNVHPNKTEVRFRDQNAVFRAVLHAVREALLAADLVPRWGGRPDDGTGEGADGARPGPLPRGVREDDGGDAGYAATASRVSPEPTVFPALWDWPERKPYGEWKAAVPGRSPGPDDSGGTSGPEAHDSSADRDRHAVGGAAGSREWRNASNTPPAARSDGRPSAAGRRAPDRANVRGLEVLGQMNDTYIVARGPDGITILDQHVVHERILYESGVARLIGPDRGSRPDVGSSGPEAESAAARDAPNSDGGVRLGLGRTQPLLVPIHLELAPEVVSVLSDHLLLLDRLGFTCEPFGSDGLLVRAVPLPLRGEHVRHRMLRKMAEEIAQLLERAEPSQAGAAADGLSELPPYLDRIVASMACRSAVMAGDRLERTEMQALVEALAGAENPFRCPHGRPILIRMPLEDVERRFGRR